MYFALAVGNSWAGDQRKSESSSVRFVEDVLKNGQSPERMAPGSGATPLTPSRDDSDDLDAPVFQPDHSPNIEGFPSFFQIPPQKSTSSSRLDNFGEI